MWFNYLFICDKCSYFYDYMDTNGAIRTAQCPRCFSQMNENCLLPSICAYEDKEKTKYLYVIDVSQGSKIIYPNQINTTQQENKVTCPYCHGTDCAKISQISRTVSTGFFGLGSSKVGKQWHCNTCKSDF